jgi:hypothetical protein
VSAKSSAPLPQILVIACTIKDHPRLPQGARLHFSIDLSDLRRERTTEKMNAWTCAVIHEGATLLLGYGNSAEAAARDVAYQLEDRR